MSTKRWDNLLPSLQKYLTDFVNSHGLGKGRRIVVGLSGGADSSFLAYFAKCYCDEHQLKLAFAHVVHGDSQTHEKMKLAVQRLASRLDVDLYILQGKFPKANENEWRLYRYGLFRDFLKDQDLLWLGHQIDDSLEWFLRQSFSRIHLPGKSGIPLKNGKIERPLHALSRNQILRFCRQFEIPYVQDPSNENLGFERSRLRAGLIPEIAREYPDYLKRFVENMNINAFVMGTHLKDKPGERDDYFIGRGDNIRYLEWLPETGKIINSLTLIIQHLIIEISQSKKQGKLRGEISRWLKSQKWNPGMHRFSGGVLGFRTAQTLFLVHESEIRNLEDRLSGILAKEATQIPVCLDLAGRLWLVERQPKMAKTLPGIWSRASKNNCPPQYAINKRGGANISSFKGLKPKPESFLSQILDSYSSFEEVFLQRNLATDTLI